MRLWNPNKISIEELKKKGILSVNEYVDNLLLKKKEKISENSNIKEIEKNISNFIIENDNNKSFFSRFMEKFSINYQILKKNSYFFFEKELIKSFDDLKNYHPILGNNINDPIINESYILNCLQGENLKILLTQISPEYLDTEHKDLILKDYQQHMFDMYKALNSFEIDVEFIKKSFVKMYSIEDKYNGQLRGQKIRHDIMLFQQAFNKNPEKFKNLDELIPVNLGTLVDVKGSFDPRIICHSIGGLVTSDSLKYAHEILISRAISAKFNLKLFVKLDQNDSETNDVLDFFKKIGNSSQLNTDIAFLDEDNMTFSNWDIKNEYIKLIVPRKFAQQFIQLGNYYDISSKETFDENYIFEVLREFDKKIRSSQTSLEQRAILIKRYQELVSYIFSKDPLLLVPSGNKSFFSSIKMFIDLSSYYQK